MHNYTDNQTEFHSNLLSCSNLSIEGSIYNSHFRTFPGFIRFFGSRLSLSPCMTWMARGPTSSQSSVLFPKPTPCSPVHVPSMANARLQKTEEKLRDLHILMPHG
ncbi:hypothetical protein CHARACLAT_016136 [Characodon lateralis]|uniref:Uncharacterized protein n=1 Tax=Characodon lateralis TaxID=208331 RepID=A0ABU7F450_9TELE|nr:hypothetical protein [Characodon lateralis]